MDLNLLLNDRPALFEPLKLRGLAEQFRGLVELRGIAQTHAPLLTAMGSRRSWQLTSGLGVINVVGPIGTDWWISYLGGTSPDAICEALRQARDDQECRTVLMIFDSPGGTSDLLEETADLIRSVDTVKPVVGIVRPFCASAAYWLASQCRELVITPSGEAGSIGAYILHIERSRLNDRGGITPTYIFSDVSPFKVEGNSNEVLSDQARAHFQSIVNRGGTKFVEYVARGRRVSPATVRAKFGGGRMLDAQEALKVRMVDRIESIEETTARLVARPSARPGSERWILEELAKEHQRTCQSATPGSEEWILEELLKDLR